jgi:hypothetical protein
MDIDKNLLGDGLNILKWKLNVKFKNTIDDYQLKTSMLRLNAGLLTTGRTLQKSGVNVPPTSLHSELIELIV